ncbi:MAG: S46 family peptidase, partial [Sphingobacteriales bacterium]
VGAPPSSIGKFGGDTDNWMWPRHTGDFSVFRIYAGRDGKPAPYSKDNIPYVPKYNFTISLKGEKKEDYAMVMGFPGNTDRYLTSYDLDIAKDYTNPAIIEAFGTQLDVMKRDMDADPKLKIELASDYASMSNTYKYYVGQERQLKQATVIAKKQEDEKAFTQWVNADNSRKEKYGTVLSNVKNTLEQYKAIEPALSHFFYGLFSTGAMKYAFGYYGFYRMNQDPKNPASQGKMDTLGASMVPKAEAYLGGVSYNTDKKVLKEILLMMYNKLGDKRPEFLNNIVKSQKKATSPQDAISKYVDNMYAESTILQKEKATAFLKKPNYKKKLLKDPAFEFLMNAVTYYTTNLAPTYQQRTASLDAEHKKYMAALREWQKDKTFYPDANSTLRVTYGNVKPYFPRDGVFYDYYTTYEGILEKQNPNDPEFVVPEKMLDLLRKKQFGRYAQQDTLRVNFLSNNDITGGNSGSPVLNANGELIGIAFDGNWESMIGDLYVNPAVNRTISVDIRYVLWVIDEFADADHLIKEMTIRE